MVADLWEGSLPAAAGPAAETVGLSVCLRVGGDGDPCHRLVEIMTTVPAEVLHHHTRAGFLGGIAVVETCPWDIRTEEGKISAIMVSTFYWFSQMLATVEWTLFELPTSVDLFLFYGVSK